MYVVPVVSRFPSAAVLYLLWPAVSAFVAGALVGHRVPAAATCGRAALRGVAVSVLAFAIFAPLYALSYALLSDGPQSPLMMMTAVFVLGLLITAPVTLVMGAVAGCALFRLARLPA
jgi:hypothetical protein